MGPLFVKTDGSLLKSLIKVNDLVKHASSLGVTTLGIVDENLYNVMDFYLSCKENNIKPIIGLNIRNVYLFAINYNGYKNLIKLETIKSERSVTNDDLKHYSSDLICVLPHELSNLYSEFYFYEHLYKGYINEEDKVEGSVYCNEVLYLNKEDIDSYKVLKAILEGISLKDVILTNRNNYFNNYGNNEYEFVDICNLELSFKQDLLPIYPCENSYEYLKKLLIEGLKSRFGSKVDKVYQERLKYELEIINKMNFNNYFLVVWDYVKFAKENGILVGPGRGSAAGSLVAYLLNITDVDPIKYNLYFERFLNPERISMPDIDIDFEYTRRDEVINYCINKYGSKKVAPIITFGTLGSKQVIRDVGKVLNINSKVIDELSKRIDSRISLKDNYKLIKNYVEEHDLNTLYKYALKLEGLKRHTSIHAAGIVMSRLDLDEVIPLHKNNNLYLTGYSMEHLESIGLLKMDFLALKNLTLLNNCLKELSISDIPLDDKLALDIFKKGDTLGVFQFESSGMIDFLKKLEVSNFLEIVIAIAFYRPGPKQFIDSYIKRKNNIEKYEYIDSLEDILSETYGIIIFQEQIMKIANVMANYSLGEADILRKAMSKKKEDVMLKEKDKFIKNSVDNGYSHEEASEVFEQIFKFASFGFNKAHSVSYALIAYKMAYLKAHYKNIFMKNLLSLVIGSDSKTNEYLTNFNLEIKKPDINLSTNDYVVYNENIFYPFTNIKAVGKTIGSVIIDNKKNKYIDIFDFFKKCGGKLNKNALINLIKADCFRSFGFNQNTLENNLDALINYSDLGDLLDDNFKPNIILYDEFSKQDLMKREFEVLGTFLSTHPSLEYKKKYTCIDLKDISKYFDKSGLFIVIIDSVRKTTTKKGEQMSFVKGSDESGSGDFILFPNVYINIQTNGLYLIQGRVEKRYDKYQIIVEKIKSVAYL